MEFLVSPEFLTAYLGFFLIVASLCIDKKLHADLMPAFTVSGLLLALILSFAFPVSQTSSLASFLFDQHNVTYASDSLGLFGCRLLLVSAILSVLLAWDYLKNQTENYAEFYVLLVFAACGLQFLVVAQEFITFFVAVETASLCLYLLAGFFREDARSSEAGLKYVILGACFTALNLYGIVLLYGVTGQTSFEAVGAAWAGCAQKEVFILAMSCILIYIGFKLSLVPFHMWAPDIYQGAPTPVSAFISVAAKTSAFILLLRIVYASFPAVDKVWTNTFLLMSVLSMFLANITAIPQKNFKRLLAYSTIGQAGYLIMGVIASNRLGVASILFFLTGYVFTNMSVFMVNSCVSTKDDTSEDLYRNFTALGGREPFLAFGLLLGILSLAGLPPLSGFSAKIFIFASAIQSGYYFLVLLALIASLISLYYYLNVLRVVYIDKISTDPEMRPSPVLSGNPLKAGLWVCIVMMLLLGIRPDILLSPCLKIAESFF